MSIEPDVLTVAQQRTLDHLRKAQGNRDDGWVARRDIPGQNRCLHRLVEIGLVERHRVAGESEYRAVLTDSFDHLN